MNKKKQGPLLYIQSTTNVNDLNEDSFLYNSRDSKKTNNSLLLSDEALSSKESLLFYLTNGQNVLGIPLKKTDKEIIILKPNYGTYTIKLNNIEKVEKYQEN